MFNTTHFQIQFTFIVNLVNYYTNVEQSSVLLLSPLVLALPSLPGLLHPDAHLHNLELGNPGHACGLHLLLLQPSPPPKFYVLQKGFSISLAAVSPRPSTGPCHGGGQSRPKTMGGDSGGVVVHNVLEETLQCFV